MADHFDQLLGRMDQLTAAIAGHIEQGQAANQGGPRPRGPSAPTFSGSSEEHVDNFIFRVDTYLQFNHLEDQQHQLLLAISCLRDHALTWYRSLQEHPADWPTLAHLMRQSFLDVDEQRQLRQELRRLKQTTSVQAYVHAFRQLMVRIDDMSVLDRIEAFINGLKPKTCREVSFHAPDALEDAYRLALRYDRNYQASAFSTPRPQAPRWTPQPPPPATSGRAMDIDAVNTQRARPLRRLTDQEREELRRRGACFRCRQDGHMARDCPLNGQGAAAKNGMRQ